MMASGYQTAGEFQGGTLAAKAATPPKQVEAFAKQLHDLASRLASHNNRLEMALNRLCGTRPEKNGVTSTDQPEPAGALLVAAFGAERVRQQIDFLSNQIERLEELA